MIKSESFDSAVKGMKFKNATNKAMVVNFAAEFKKRGIDVEKTGM